MDCEHFCNEHCSFDCPNFEIDIFEERYDLPASEIGLERVSCKDCQYSDKNCDCDDCYFRNSENCSKEISQK